IQTKLQNLAARHEELKGFLADPDVTNDLNRYRDLSKEYAQIEPYVQMYHQHQDMLKQLDESKLLLEEDDEELQQLAKQEIKTIEEKLAKIEEELLLALLPKD